MKIKILKYTRNNCSHVIVQGHNKKRGKWKPNPNWDLHQMLSSSVENRKEYGKEIE